MGVLGKVVSAAKEVEKIKNDAKAEAEAAHAVHSPPPPPKRKHWPSFLCSCNRGHDVCCWGIFCCCCHIPQLLVRAGKDPNSPNLAGCCSEEPIPLAPWSCVNAPLCWLMCVCPFLGWCEVCNVREMARDRWLDTDNYMPSTPRWLINCLCCCCNLECACCQCFRCCCCCMGDDQMMKCDMCLVGTCCPCCSNIQAHVLMDEELGFPEKHMRMHE